MTNLVRYKQDAYSPAEFQKCCNVRKGHQGTIPGGHSVSFLIPLHRQEVVFPLTSRAYKNGAPPGSTPGFCHNLNGDLLEPRCLSPQTHDAGCSVGCMCNERERTLLLRAMNATSATRTVTLLIARRLIAGFFRRSNFLPYQNFH